MPGEGLGSHPTFLAGGPAPPTFWYKKKIIVLKGKNEQMSRWASALHAATWLGPAHFKLCSSIYDMNTVENPNLT